MVKTSPQKVSSPMKRLSYLKRMEIKYAHGLAAVIESDGDLDMAIKLFKDVSHRPYPRNLKRFLQGVWHRYEAGDIKITTRATPKRSKMLSDEDVCLESEGLRALLKETGVNPQYLWSRAKQVNPKLHRTRIIKTSRVNYIKGIKQSIKAKTMDQSIKDERLHFVNKQMQRSLRKRMCDTYVEEGNILIGSSPSMFTISEGRKRSGHTGIPLAPFESRVFPKEACGKLSFIIAVHPILGLVYFDYLTPTTPAHAPKKSNGRRYKGISSKEFGKQLAKIKAKLMKLSGKNRSAFQGGGVHVIVDNVTFHTTEVIESFKKLVIELPPKSPELNKPVKRVIEDIKREFWKRYGKKLDKSPTGYVTFQSARRMLRQVAKDVVKPENIAKDVKAMRDTYLAISHAQGA